MITLWFLLVLLLALGPLVHFYGVDTRDGRDWQPYDIMSPHT